MDRAGNGTFRIKSEHEKEGKAGQSLDQTENKSYHQCIMNRNRNSRELRARDGRMGSLIFGGMMRFRRQINYAMIPTYDNNKFKVD